MSETKEAVTKPPKLDRCVEHLMEQGHTEESAFAICNSVLSLLGESEENAGMVVTEIKTVPIRKFYQADMKALKNGDIEAYVSTESIDRVGDIIRAKGWHLDNYIKSGSPVLFSHDYGQPPIGKASEIQVQRKGLWSITHFHEKTQLSRDLAILARGGDMKAWSVGFNALEPPESRTEDGVFKGYIFNKQELLEYSLVAVPANPEAVSKAIHLAQTGKISQQTACIFAGPSPLPEAGNGQAQETKAAVTMPVMHGSVEQHVAKMAGLHFLKRLTDVRA